MADLAAAPSASSGYCPSALSAGNARWCSRCLSSHHARSTHSHRYSSCYFFPSQVNSYNSVSRDVVRLLVGSSPAAAAAKYCTISLSPWPRHAHTLRFRRFFLQGEREPTVRILSERDALNFFSAAAPRAALCPHAIWAVELCREKRKRCIISLSIYLSISHFTFAAAAFYLCADLAPAQPVK